MGTHPWATSPSLRLLYGMVMERFGNKARIAMPSSQLGEWTWLGYDSFERNLHEIPMRNLDLGPKIVLTKQDMMALIDEVC